jgi:hypothetical protein
MLRLPVDAGPFVANPPIANDKLAPATILLIFIRRDSPFVKLSDSLRGIRLAGEFACRDVPLDYMARKPTDESAWDVSDSEARSQPPAVSHMLIPYADENREKVTECALQVR